MTSPRVVYASVVDGDDLDGDGSAERPFQSAARALTVARPSEVLCLDGRLYRVDGGLYRVDDDNRARHSQRAACVALAAAGLAFVLGLAFQMPSWALVVTVIMTAFMVWLDWSEP